MMEVMDLSSILFDASPELKGQSSANLMRVSRSLVPSQSAIWIPEVNTGALMRKGMTWGATVGTGAEQGTAVIPAAWRRPIP